MLKVNDRTLVEREWEASRALLGRIARDGAPRMLMEALEPERDA
jgi:hypothetical protein